mgnify:CR=1 FL=1
MLRHQVGVLAQARLSGREIVLVTSGAIAAGLSPLGLKIRPRDLATQQAAMQAGGEYREATAEDDITCPCDSRGQGNGQFDQITAQPQATRQAADHRRHTARDIDTRALFAPGATDACAAATAAERDLNSQSR